MSLLFPTSPNPGDIYVANNGSVYTWVGDRWSAAQTVQNLGQTIPVAYGSQIVNNGNVVSVDNSGTLTLSQGGLTSPSNVNINIYPSPGNAAVVSNFSGYNQYYVQDNGAYVKTSADNSGTTFSYWKFGLDGTTQLPYYTFPATTGTIGQILTWPADGTTLVWSNQTGTGGTASPNWYLTSSTGATLSLNPGGPFGVLELNTGTFGFNTGTVELSTGTWLAIDSFDNGAFLLGNIPQYGINDTFGANFIFGEDPDTLAIASIQGINLADLSSNAGITVGYTGLNEWSPTGSQGTTGTVTVYAAGQSSLKTWAFGADGNLTLPYGSTINDSTYGLLAGSRAVEIMPGGGNNVNQLLKIYPTVVSDGNHIHLTSGDLSVTDLFLGDDHQFVRIGADGTVCIGTNSAGNIWQFGTDSTLTLPNGGNIDTLSGTGGFKITTDGQIQFASGYSIGGSDTGLGLRMATDRGTILFGNHPECVPTAHSHFHIMKQDVNNVELFLGDDNNYVKLPGTQANAYGVEIGTNDVNGGGPQVWRFGTDGILNLPSGVGDIKRDGVTVLGVGTVSSLNNNGYTVALNSQGHLDLPGGGYLVFGDGTTQTTAVLKGDPGIQGIQGIQGPQGIQGLIGNTGTQGIQGPQGDSGIQGPKGDQGIQGPQGSKGQTGDTGPQGVSVTLKGTKATIADLPLIGSAGDGWIVTTGDGGSHLDGSLWFWNVTDGVWNDIGLIVGPAGPRGEPGADGAQGPQGNAGEQGIQGSKGDQGPQGDAGAQGIQGNTGTQGIQGPQGDVGPQGDIGPAGLTYQMLNGIHHVTLLSNGNLELSDTNSIVSSDGSVWKFSEGGVGGLLRLPNGTNVYEQSGFVVDSIGDIQLNAYNGETPHSWVLGINGHLTFPDMSVQTTAWTGTIAYSNITNIPELASKPAVSDVAPTTATTGTLWYDEIAGRMYIYYDNYWIDASPGTDGIVGYTGSQGDTGYNGSLGYTGSVGNNGNSGYIGSQGITGYDGSLGYTGSTGDIGYVGSRGADGTSVRIIDSVTSATDLLSYPTVSLAIGDGIIESDTGHLNIWTGSTWNDVGTIVGPQGNTGAAGSSGYTGSSGVAGVNGYNGSAGATGSIGYTGSAGATGSTGYVGSQGITGYTGSVGLTGYNGSSGVTGSTGYNGSVGYTGSTGVTGSTGYNGSVGYTGSVGVGYAGSTGSTGYVGSSGIGYTGSAGVSADQTLNTTSNVIFAAVTANAAAGTTSTLQIGYLGIPQKAISTGSSYTLVLTDQGKHVYTLASSGQTVNIPTNAAVPFPIGTAVTLVLKGNGPLTVSPTSTSTTLYLAGTATPKASVSMAAMGMATLLKVENDVWFVNGNGVT